MRRARGARRRYRPDEYAEAQQVYDDCLLRTGEDGGEENGGSGDGGDGAGGGDSECTAPDADAPADEMREYEECLEANGEMTNDDTVPGESAGGDGGGEGGLNGMMLGGFKHIMNTIWDWTFGWALENMAEAFQTNLLSLPDLEQQGDLLSAYKSSVEKLRPVILVGILVLGILMMLRSDNYDLAYAGFQGLPRLMGVALALAFLPQFMGELSRITSGIGAAFFPGGQDVSAAGAELYKAAIGNLVITNFLNLLLFIVAGYVSIMLFIVALLNKILYSLLFVSGAFALTASIVPSLNSLAGSWFRGVLASAAIPALWSIEMGIGTVAITSPESIFGSMANSVGFISNSAVTSIGAIITMWVMYKTPFKCIEWAFNVQLPGRGGLMSLAKTGAALAVAIPAKTAIAHATKSLLNRSSGSGGAVVASKTGKDGKTAISGKQGAGGSAGAKARQIQQIGNQGNRARVAENITKAHDKYSRQRDRTQEVKERFMQDGRKATGGAGMGKSGRSNWQQGLGEHSCEATSNKGAKFRTLLTITLLLLLMTLPVGTGREKRRLSKREERIERARRKDLVRTALRSAAVSWLLHLRRADDRGGRYDRLPRRGSRRRLHRGSTRRAGTRDRRC